MGKFAESILDLLFEYQEIRDGCEAGSRIDGPVYLKRYFIVRNTDADRSAGVQHVPRFNLTVHRERHGAQLYLHHILRSDADRELHDHPWAFVSIILWRGYREETQWGEWWHWGTKLQRKWPGFILFRAAEHRHRLHLVGGPAWSLVFTSLKKRTWGFWRTGCFIPWREFVARKCEDHRG